jgi:ankyrin repeat protein
MSKTFDKVFHKGEPDEGSSDPETIKRAIMDDEGDLTPKELGNLIWSWMLSNAPADQPEDLHAIKTAIRKGADVNFTDEVFGHTALTLAAWHARTAIVEALLDGGANINAETIYGASALYLAIDDGYRDTAALLISRGADINVTHCGGRTLRTLAANRGMSDLLPPLNSHGLKPPRP